MRTFSLIGAAATLILAIFVTACGSGGGSASSGSARAGTGTPVSDEAFRAAAEQAATSTLLTRADFPAGWTGEASEDSDSDLPVSEACREFFTTPEAYPGAVIEKESLEFGAGHEEAVSSDAGVYRTDAEAQQAQAQMVDFLSRCRGELETAFTQYLSGAPGVVSAEVKFTDQPSPEKGDWSHAFTFSMSIKGAFRTTHADVHIALMRYGRLCGSVSYYDDGTFPPASGKRLVNVVAARMDKASKSLPS